MKLGHLLAHLRQLEDGLVDSLCAAADRHSDDHDVFHQCRTFAARATTRAEKLDRIRDRYPGEAEWASAVSGESDDLLENLRALHLRIREVAITWEMAAQAAKATRDQDLLVLSTASQTQVGMQAKWIETRIKTSAPQALVVA
jgi:Lon protease-like protein